MPSLASHLHAITLSSHNGEARHIRLVKQLLGSWYGSLLRTPRCEPLGGSRVSKQSRLSHPCSGEHAGLLLTCHQHGWDPKTYLQRQHPTTQHYESYLRQHFAATWEPRDVAIDGCGLTTHAMTVFEHAVLYSDMAATRKQDRVWSSATAHPDIIGGRNRLDSHVMRLCDGAVLAKEGADGLLALSIVHKDFPQGIGAVVKLTHGWDGGVMSYVASAILKTFDFEVPPLGSMNKDICVNPKLTSPLELLRLSA